MAGANNKLKNENEKLDAPLHPSLELQVQYSVNILCVPVLIRQYRSSPPMPGSPKNAQLR